MPTYAYYCPSNGRTVDVMHGMTTTLDTWDEVCAKAELEPDDTPGDAKVEKLLGAGMTLASKPQAGEACETRPMGGCCGGMCRGH